MIRQVGRIHGRPRRQIDDGPRQSEAMAGPDHRRDPFLALSAVIGGRGRERPDPPALRELQRRCYRFGIAVVARGRSVLLLDARPSQLLDEPTPAIPSGGKPLGLNPPVKSRGKLASQMVLEDRR